MECQRVVVRRSRGFKVRVWQGSQLGEKVCFEELWMQLDDCLPINNFPKLKQVRICILSQSAEVKGSTFTTWACGTSL